MTVITQPAYLYAIWRDNFVVKKGEVSIFLDFKRPKAQFDCDGVKNYIQVSPVSGEIHSAKLWLPERDDERAKQILRDYHKECIASLQKQLESHSYKLDILK